MSIERIDITTEGKQTKKKENLKRSQSIGWICQIVTDLFLQAALLAVFLVRWLFATWPDLNLTELMYQMNSPIRGTSQEMIQGIIGSCVIPAGVSLVLLILITLFSAQKNWLGRTSLIQILVTALLLGGCYQALAGRLDMKDYLRSQKKYSDFIDSNYVDPATVTITFPEKKRNLIYIYLESMESTYAHMEDEDGNQVNYIPELTKLAEENIHFSDSSGLGGAHPTEYTSWTIGGIFAQSSGLPLKTDMRENDMHQQKDFFPTITCLGDLLEGAGYRQAFLCGSDLTFGGRDKFLNEHGDFQKCDYYWAIDQGYLDEDYYVWWGYEDRKLFDYAKTLLDDLSKGEQPFNLSILTVDTHFEDGYVCEECGDFYSTDYANVLACSSRQVNAFLQWAKTQDWYENTSIILSGDHLTMDRDFCTEVKKEDRSVYNCFVNSAVTTNHTKNRSFSTLDLFPTTLAALGCRIEGERLGLGVNLFSGKETLLEQYGLGKVNREFLRNSQLFEHLNKDYATWEYWEKTDKGWKYYLTKEERYAENEWVTYEYNMDGIHEKTFFFDEQGYAVFGWAKINDIWYYFDKDWGLVENPEGEPPIMTVGLVYFPPEKTILQPIWEEHAPEKKAAPYEEILLEHGT